MTITHSIIIAPISSLFRHLWLSISSIRFYENLYLRYSGYGFRYAFTLCFFSAIFCTAIFLNNLNSLSHYLKNNSFSSNVAILDHILSQIPDLNYDGDSISIEEESPLFVNTPSNFQILALDPENKLSPSERSKIPILLTSKNIVISLIDSKNEVYKIIPFKYEQIFGNNSQILTQSVIKSHLAQMISKVPFLVTYVIFPIMVLFLFIKSILDQIFSIIFLYFISYLFGFKMNLASCTRMLIFANGIVILLQPIISLTFPYFVNIFRLVDLWTGLLLCAGILKANNKTFVF